MERREVYADVFEHLIAELSLLVFDDSLHDSADGGIPLMAVTSTQFDVLVL
jgi:hypothetical protein